MLNVPPAIQEAIIQARILIVNAENKPTAHYT
uniref:Uncharacterized protein n=1 Tax=Candidatus Nitrotoga fabula TaxID=2182327 RepID=A0A2X0SMZ0_9PROT|nr:protein of unknown function [Candidatus Nitrotoga fabula]